jgi:hypothetical protein
MATHTFSQTAHAYSCTTELIEGIPDDKCISSLSYVHYVKLYMHGYGYLNRRKAKKHHISIYFICLASGHSIWLPLIPRD